MSYRSESWMKQVYYVFRWKVLRWLDRLGAKRR